MSDDRDLRDDLSFIRRVIDRAEDEATNPATVYFLWAVISFFGYSIIDFAPEKTGFYWMIGGPVGGVLSGVLAERAGRRAGRVECRGSRNEALHWTGLFVSILLLLPLVTTGAISNETLPRLILLLVALAYFLAGVHLDRRMRPIGLVLALCYLFTVFARDVRYVWTITAAILAGSLVVAGLFAAVRERRGPGSPTA